MNNINGCKITKIEILNYNKYNNLAIELISGKDSFATLSVNLDQELPFNMAYVDINNCPWAKEFIEKNNLGNNTYITKQSGFCEYPLYIFDLEKIKEYNKKRR